MRASLLPQLDLPAARPLRKEEDLPAEIHSALLATLEPNEESRRSAYDMIVRSYWDHVHAYLRSMPTTKEDAEDLTQGFFTAILAKNKYSRAHMSWLLGGPPPQENLIQSYAKRLRRQGPIGKLPPFGKWILVRARQYATASIARQRARPMEVCLACYAQPAEESVLQREEQESFRRRMAAISENWLTPAESAVLQLYGLSDMTLIETARILKLSPASIRDHWRHARDILVLIYCYLDRGMSDEKLTLYLDQRQSPLEVRAMLYRTLRRVIKRPGAPSLVKRLCTEKGWSLRDIARAWDVSERKAKSLLDQETERASRPAPVNPTVPIPFAGGELVIHPDRVELNGVVVLTDQGTGLMRQLLLVLKAKQDGSIHEPLSVRKLAAQTDPDADVAKAILRFRDTVTREMAKERNVHCGRMDVIESGRHGYRLAKGITARLIQNEGSPRI
jgi:DNA-directed RNA polymerase specialized sigma24 family protein